MIDAPRANFVDGLRVTALHLNHLQDSALAAAEDLREIVGLGRIGIGLRLVVEGGAVTLSRGTRDRARRLADPARRGHARPAARRRRAVHRAHHGRLARPRGGADRRRADDPLRRRQRRGRGEVRPRAALDARARHGDARRRRRAQPCSRTRCSSRPRNHGHSGSSSRTRPAGASTASRSSADGVPASLLLQTCRLACPTTALSKTILFLSTSVVESTMRKALLLTLVTFTLGVGITTGRWFLGSSDAQDPFQQHAGQPPASVYYPPAQSYYSVNLPLSTWEYKVLMGDGNASVESKLNVLGGAGWELCTASSTPADQMMFVFKRLRKPTTQTEERRFQPVEKSAKDVFTDQYRFSQGKVAYEDAVTSKTTSTINIPLQHTSVTEMALIVKDVFTGCKMNTGRTHQQPDYSRPQRDADPGEETGRTTGSAGSQPQRQQEALMKLSHRQACRVTPAGFFAGE